jgi:hypothetical protein
VNREDRGSGGLLRVGVEVDFGEASLIVEGGADLQIGFGRVGRVRRLRDSAGAGEGPIAGVGNACGLERRIGQVPRELVVEDDGILVAVRQPGVRSVACVQALVDGRIDERAIGQCPGYLYVQFGSDSAYDIVLAGDLPVSGLGVHRAGVVAQVTSGVLGEMRGLGAEPGFRRGEGLCGIGWDADCGRR